MLAGVAAFSAMDVVLKHLSERYTPLQVTFLRGATSLPLLVAASALSGRLHTLRAQRVALHLARGCLMFMTMWGFVWSVARLSLANTYAIFMCAPLLMTALSRPLLREHVSPARWLAVLVGLSGVVVALRPSGSGFSVTGGLGALLSALSYSLSSIMIRYQSRSESTLAIASWPLLLMTLLSGAAAQDGWVELRSDDWPWYAALGVTGAIGQQLVTQAFRSAPPQLVAPLEYSALLWGILYDALLWSTWPELRVLLGASIVAASGVYVIRSATRDR